MSITMRVSRVETQIAYIREQIRTLEAMVENDPTEVLRALVEIRHTLQGTRSQVDEIRNLVRYK